jgi:hypothetical protein
MSQPKEVPGLTAEEKMLNDIIEDHEPHTTHNSCPGVWYKDQVKSIAETYAASLSKLSEVKGLPDADKINLLVDQIVKDNEKNPNAFFKNGVYLGVHAAISEALKVIASLDESRVKAIRERVAELEETLRTEKSITSKCSLLARIWEDQRVLTEIFGVKG